MTVIVTSTTDSPEDIAAATGAELETEPPVVPAEGEELPAEGVTPPVKKETDDEAVVEGEEEEGNEEEEEPAEGAEPVKPKKVTGYKKKAQRLEEENRLLMDLLRKQENPEPEEKPTEEEQAVAAGLDPKTKTYSGIAKPKLEDFKDEKDPYAIFTEKSVEWAMKEGEAKAKFEKAQEATNAAAAAVQEAFNGRLAEVKKEGGVYADYDDVLASIANEDLPVTPLMTQMIMTSKAKDGTPISADVMYFLASNPDRVREISAMAPEEQAAEMGLVRQEAWAETQRRVAAAGKGGKKTNSDSSGKGAGPTGAVPPQQQQQPPKPKAKTPPPPVNPVGKRAAPAAKDLASVAESGDFKEYEARRRQQGFKYR